MKKFFAVIVVLMLATGTAWADKKDSNWVPPGHRYTHGKGGVTATAIANPVIRVTPVQQSWMTANQSIAAGAFTSNFTGGPTTTNVDVAVTGQGQGTGSGKQEIDLNNNPDFLSIGTYQAAPAMDYRGTYKPTAMVKLQPWFNNGHGRKFMADFFKKYPKSGKITVGPIEPADPVNYFYVKDARDRLENETNAQMIKRLKIGREDLLQKDGETEEQYIDRLLQSRAGVKVADLICESETAQDNSITVWGACGDALVKAGVKYAHITGASVTDWVSFKTSNAGGSAGGSSIFGLLFGVTAQGGMNVAEGTSGPAEKVMLIIDGFADPKPVEKK